MIICVANGSRSYYTEAFIGRRFIARNLAELRNKFDKMEADELYGNSMIVIECISGATFDEFIENEEWLNKHSYYFYYNQED